MDKATPHHPQQQLSLELDAAAARSTKEASVDPIVQEVKAGSATSVVLDFQSARSERIASKDASLYRRILDSVRHLG
jgi:hypothetical protein